MRKCKIGVWTKYCKYIYVIGVKLTFSLVNKSTFVLFSCTISPTKLRLQYYTIFNKVFCVFLNPKLDNYLISCTTSIKSSRFVRNIYINS